MGIFGGGGGSSGGESGGGGKFSISGAVAACLAAVSLGGSPSGTPALTLTSQNEGAEFHGVEVAAPPTQKLGPSI